MARPDKAAAVATLAEAFRTSHAAVLTEYRGLTVAQLKELRRSLGEGASYAVVKNTLTKLAAKEAGVEAFDGLIQGPSAIAFVKGDPVEAAKGLRDFAKAHPLLVIKGGVLDGKTLSTAEIQKLADLESREVLLAKLAGAMNASLQGAVSLFAAPLSQTARLLEALRVKAEADPSVLRGGAGTPAAAEESATTDEAATTDAPAPDEAATTTDEAATTGETSTADETTDAPAPDEAATTEATTTTEVTASEG